MRTYKNWLIRVFAVSGLTVAMNGCTVLESWLLKANTNDPIARMQMHGGEWVDSTAGTFVVQRSGHNSPRIVSKEWHVPAMQKCTLSIGTTKTTCSCESGDSRMCGAIAAALNILAPPPEVVEKLSVDVDGKVAVVITDTTSAKEARTGSFSNAAQLAELIKGESPFLIGLFSEGNDSPNWNSYSCVIFVGLKTDTGAQASNPTNDRLLLVGMTRQGLEEVENAEGKTEPSDNATEKRECPPAIVIRKGGESFSRTTTPRPQSFGNDEEAAR